MNSSYESVPFAPGWPPGTLPASLPISRWSIARPASLPPRKRMPGTVGGDRFRRRLLAAEPLPDPAEVLEARIEAGAPRHHAPRHTRSPSARSNAPAPPSPPPSNNLPSSAMNISARPRPKSSARAGHRPPPPPSRKPDRPPPSRRTGALRTGTAGRRNQRAPALSLRTP